MLGHGCTAGWVSPALPLLKSNNTILSTGPISKADESWIGSTDCIGAFFGTAFYGYLLTVIGNKQSMLLIAIPSAMHWVLIYFGTTPNHLIAARFATGWAGGGIQTAIVLYISEIANDEYEITNIEAWFLFLFVWNRSKSENVRFHLLGFFFFFQNSR